MFVATGCDRSTQICFVTLYRRYISVGHKTLTCRSGGHHGSALQQVGVDERRFAVVTGCKYTCTQSVIPAGSMAITAILSMDIKLLLNILFPKQKQQQQHNNNNNNNYYCALHVLNCI